MIKNDIQLAAFDLGHPGLTFGKSQQKTMLKVSHRTQNIEFNCNLHAQREKIILTFIIVRAIIIYTFYSLIISVIVKFTLQEPEVTRTIYSELFTEMLHAVLIIQHDGLPQLTQGNSVPRKERVSVKQNLPLNLVIGHVIQPFNVYWLVPVSRTSPIDFESTVHGQRTDRGRCVELSKRHTDRTAFYLGVQMVTVLLGELQAQALTYHRASLVGDYSSARENHLIQRDTSDHG